MITEANSQRGTMRNSNNVLLVGGGITSSLITFLLRNNVSYVFEVWEAHEEIGGRMRTFYNEFSSTNIDLGAQYVTTDENRLRLYHTVYDFLISHNILTPLICNVENLRTQPKNTCNYVARDGMSSLVKQLFANSNIRNIRTSLPVKCLNIQEQIILANEGTESFDAVILTPPVPDILEIQGSFREIMSEEHLHKLKQIKYSSRFVLVLVYNQVLNVTWAATYMPSDQIFRYAAIQEKKVESGSCHSSVVLHTSVEFGTEYKEPEEVQSILEEHVRRIFPEWPQPIRVNCYKWDHSQVTSAYENKPGCVVLHTKPLVVITGDGFTASNFDGCIAAANSTIDVMFDVFANR